MQILAYAFDSTCEFPFQKCMFKFQGRELVIYSGNEEHCDIIQTIIADPDEWEEVVQIINKFLFCFGWDNKCSFHYTGSIDVGISSSVDLLSIDPVLKVKRKFRTHVGFSTTIHTNKPELDLALSLYNDAHYSNDVFFEFFCYWKILEIPYPGKKLSATDWINDAIQKKKNILIFDEIEELIKQKKDIGEYFRSQCRNSIAHVERKPTVVSFKPNDYIQIQKACWGIEPFVEYFIKNEIGTPRYSKRIEVIQTL